VISYILSADNTVMSWVKLCAYCVLLKSDLEHTLSQLVVDDDDDVEDDDGDTERHAHSVPIVCSLYLSSYHYAEYIIFQ